jgi:hypothetical protein
MDPGTSNLNHESARLSRNLRPAITQVFAADLFVEYNQTHYEETNTFFAFGVHDRKWRVARDTYSTQWEHAVWSEPDESDILPMIYHDLIGLIRPLVETASHAEQRRVMSHSFIAGVIRLLQNDQRMRVTAWGLQHTIPPVAERLEEERQDNLRGRSRT